MSEPLTLLRSPLPLSGAGRPPRRTDTAGSGSGRHLSLSLVSGLAFVTAASFGFSWGNVGNQETYMLAPLAAADPALFHGDWLVGHTYNYHPRFAALVVALSALGDMRFVTALFNLAATLAGLAAIGLMVHGSVAQQERKDLVVGPAVLFSGLLLMLIAGESRSVGDSYIFSTGLQPSVLASVCWLAGIAAFQRQRWLAAGLLVGAGGFWHINFLVLGLPVFAAALVIYSPRGVPGRLVPLLLPSLLLLALDLPTLAAAGAGKDVDAARAILQTFRAPHHYLPLTYLYDFLPFGFWTIAGTVAMSAMWRDRAARALGAVALSCCMAVAAATLLTTVVFIPQVSQAFVWRVAPFGVLTCQILVLSWYARTRPWSPSEGRLRILVLAGALAIAAADVVHGERMRSIVPLVLVFLGTGMLLDANGIRPRKLPGLTGAGLLVALVAATPTAWKRIDQLASTSTLNPWASARPMRGLCRWAGSTPVDALFLIPPQDGAFRVLCKRPVVVDWKSTPMLPDELLEWRRRISLVSGLSDPHAEAAVLAGYAAMSRARLARLGQMFGADFAVFHLPAPKDLRRLPVAYSDGAYVVLRLPEAAETGTPL